MNIQSLVAALWHHLFHRYVDHLLERGEGEVYLRCSRCGLRSPGIVTGPPRLASALPGYPERHRRLKVARVPLAVLEVEVEVARMPEPWEKHYPPSGRAVRVH